MCNRDRISEILKNYDNSKAISRLNVAAVICDVQYWRDSSEWTKYLLMTHFENIDFDYLWQRAIETGCAEVLKDIIQEVKDELEE